MQWIKKSFRLLFFLLVLFLFSLAVGVVGDQWLFPWLSSMPALNRFQFFQKSNEKTTIINKTEQIIVKEDNSLFKAAERIASSLVEIVAFVENEETKTIQINQDPRMKTREGLTITSDGLVMSVADEETGSFLLQNKKIKYKVLFSNGTEAVASLAGYDGYSNLIFYRIENSNNWTVPAWGDSKKLTSGDKVAVCSFAKKEGQSIVVESVVRSRKDDFSLLNSELSFSEKMEGAIFLSSEKAIDQENIGSPVINSEGEVVGVANLFQKNNQVTGFVLPLDLIEKTIERAIKNQFSPRPTLGLYYLSIDKALAIANGLPANSGALVYSFSGQQGLAVLKNSPADEAGIKIGDIITEFNGEKITSSRSLSGLVSEKNKGDKIKIKLLRDKKEVEIELVLE